MKTPPDPLTMGPPRFSGPICLFPHPPYTQTEAPAKTPGLFARIGKKSSVSVEWAFLINYYKSISGFIRKRVFSRGESFPYDFRRILSLASSGFPLNWGVKNTSDINFFCKKMGLCAR